MTTHEYLKNSFISAAGVLVYTLGLATLLFNSERLLPLPAEPNLLYPVLAMMTLVISATITGLMVLGRPINLYMNGKRTEAFTLLYYTIGWLIVLAVLVVVAVVAMAR
jgi:hypothetical protein